MGVHSLMTKTRRITSAEQLPLVGNHRDERAARRAVTQDPFADLKMFSPTPLVDGTVAAAVVDARFFCIGLNEAFSALKISLERPRAGQPVSEIFAVYADLIEKGLREVLQSGAPVFNVELPSGWLEASKGRKWVADLFPVRLDGRSGGLLGTAVSETISRRDLEWLSSESIFETEQFLGEVENSSGDDCAAAFARYIAVFRESTRLLNASKSLRGYVSCLRVARKLHRDSQPEWIDSVRRVQSGPILPAALGGEVAPFRAKPTDGNGHAAPKPSTRELQVLRLLADGKGNKEIGVLLQLSTRTVESYRARLKLRLNLHSEAEMVRYAIRNHIIKP
jgi:DNA-binding CsgD family transcriptional regulator